MGKTDTEDSSETTAIVEKEVSKQERGKPKRVRISAEISGDIAERIKNAVYWTPGMTMAGFVEEALTEAIKGLEDEKGERFPQRERNLVGGRPMV